MKLTAFAVIMILAMAGCQDNFSGDQSRQQADMPQSAPYEEKSRAFSGDQPASEPAIPQKIIRNGFMSIKVDDAAKTKQQVEALLPNYKAYIGNEQFDNTDYSASYHMQIRVPSENLDALIDDLEKLEGSVTNKSINATDVTEEYIDIETRLANKRAYLTQYRELLKNARTVEDILKVREQIRILEEEIESAEGRLKYLQNQVALSTLNLTLLQEKDYVFRGDRRINFFERLKESLSTGWYGFVDFMIRLIGLWPFWILLIVVIWLLKRYTGRKKAE